MTMSSVRFALCVALASVSCVGVFAALQKGGGDCSAGADQAAKNDICGGPTKGFCVDSKTSKAACACFDAYEGPLCQTLAATPSTGSSSSSSSSSTRNALTALALGLGGAYFLNSLGNRQSQVYGPMDQYLLSGTVNPSSAAFSAAQQAASLDGMLGTGSAMPAAIPIPSNPVALGAPMIGNSFKG
ncbi:uncharacterized protein LOC111115777 isoform X2 [Crassostrea virginica]